MNRKVEDLLQGKTIVSKEGGNSMMPIIKSMQPCKIEPITWDKCKKDDIVYCKVKGRFYTHFVKAIDEKRGCLIGNNRGKINGWTKRVYGKIIEIII